MNDLKGKKVYVRDAFACADPSYKTTIRVITETAYQNLFSNNLLEIKSQIFFLLQTLHSFLLYQRSVIS